MTKSSEIKETPRDLNWNFNLGQLTNVSVPEINSKNRSTCVQSFQTKQTNLPKSIPKIPSQNKSSKRKKSDFNHFYNEIITNSMLDFSFRDSKNPEIHRLHQKASLLAASSLAKTIESNYGRVWVLFLDF